MLRSLVRSRMMISTATRSASSALLQTSPITPRMRHRSAVPWKRGYARSSVSLGPETEAGSSSSSSHSIVNDLEYFTDKIVRRTPLGTMTQEQWDDSLVAMVYWFQQNEEQGGAIEGGQTTTKVTASSVNKVDRLLQRLVHEYATQSVPSRQHRRSDLAPWLLAVLQAWLEVGREFPASQLAPKHADEAWRRLASWYERGWWTEGGLLPATECVGVIQACLRLESPEGASRAAELLLVKEYFELFETEKELITQCYHEALKQSLEFADSSLCGSIASGLLERMERLSEQPGWEELKLDTEEISGVLNNLLQEGNLGKQRQAELSAFEQGALQRRILDLVAAAGVEERTAIEDMVDRWDDSSSSQASGRIELMEALADFYIRIKEPHLATQWMQKVENVSAGNDVKLGRLEQQQELIRLWTGSDDPQAPWRATELLESLEKLSSSRDDWSLDSSLYVSVADLWSKSTSTRRSQNAADIALRSPSFHDSFIPIIMKANAEDTMPSKEGIASLVEFLNRQWDEIDAQKLPIIIEDTAKAIERCKTPASAFELVNLLTRKNIVPSATICEHLLRSLSRSSELDDIINLMDAFEKSGANLTLASYRVAVTCLLAEGASSERGVLLALDFLDSQREKIDAEQLSSILEDIVNDIERCKTPASAFAMLNLLRRRDMIPPTWMFGRLLKSFPESTQPDDILKLMDAFEKNGAKFTFACYKSAITRLFRIRNKPRMSEVKHVFAVLLDELEQGLEADSKQLGQLVLDVLLFTKRDAIKILRVAEGKLLNADKQPLAFPIPLECYRVVAKLLLSEGETDGVEEIFNRVLSLYRSGHDDMAPDGNFYELYSVALYKSKEKGNTSEKRERLFNDLLQLYDSTGEARFKPTYRMFYDRFLVLKERPTKENLLKALPLINKMIAMGVECPDPFIFDQVMQLALNCPKTNQFRVVMDILQQLEKANVAPDYYVLSDVLTACSRANSKDHQQALHVALSTLVKIRSSSAVKSNTYGLMFLVIQRIAPDQDLEKLVSSVFQACCEDGCVNDGLRETAKKLVSPSTWKRLNEMHLSYSRQKQSVHTSAASEQIQ